MNAIKRGLIGATIVGSLMAGLASVPTGVGAQATPNQNGANCHGEFVSRAVTLAGIGLGRVAGGPLVQEFQQRVRITCT